MLVAKLFHDGIESGSQSLARDRAFLSQDESVGSACVEFVERLGQAVENGVEPGGQFFVGRASGRGSLESFDQCSELDIRGIPITILLDLPPTRAR